MRNFAKNRIIPIVLVVAIMVTMVVPFASAEQVSGGFVGSDTGARDLMTDFFNTGSSTSQYINDLLSSNTLGLLSVSDILWFIMDQRVNRVRAARHPKGTSIENRPHEITARTSWGHWEMDTVIGHAKGKGQAALVLTERLTDYELIFKLKDKTAKSVVSTLSKLARRCDFPNIFKSITVDNGSEFQDCKGMERLKTKVYYCHPYTSCERGRNERMNRMIRRFFPKGSDFSKLKQEDCSKVADYLNNYERKSLGGKTPLALWQEYTTLPPL